MAQLFPIGQPNNDGERKAIAYLLAHLPDEYRVFTNFEIKRGKLWYEIDSAVVAPHAVYIVDFKGTHGRIMVEGRKWHPEGRAPFTSPLIKLREHAKSAHGMLADCNGKPYRDRVWFEAVVLLVADNAALIDPTDRDASSTMLLNGCERYFTDPRRLSRPDGFPEESTQKHLKSIHDLIEGPNARPTKGLPQFRNWICTERLTSTDVYVEYRAVNEHSKTSRAMLRVYRANPYLQEDERTQQKNRIENAYRALEQLSAHPCIPISRDFFPTQDGDGYVMVTDDVTGPSLSQRLKQAQEPLTFDQKITIIKDILRTLAHCHHHGVIHRALSPATVVLTPDGSIRLTDFDFARPGERGTGSMTVAGELLEAVNEAYLAPEILSESGVTGPSTDIYAAGVTFYELLTGNLPWRLATDAYGQGCCFPEPASAHVPALNERFDQWLQSLCNKESGARPDAKAALEQLEDVLNPQPPRRIEEVSEDEPDMDFLNLQPGQEIDGKYVIEKKLGKPGSFGVVYKVVDTMGDVPRALKIITQDHRSVLARMKQEFKVLVHLPPHPRVVRVFDARVLNPGGYPYLVFEYLEGSDLSEIIAKNTITLAESVKMVREVAEGLAHLHRNKVTHGDIKPANLLWTNQTVKIVDFNVAKSQDDLLARGGGTRRYIPPDFDPTVPSTEDSERDRDLFALGVTFYEAVTGLYPWADDKRPVADKPPRDPRELPGLENLSHKVVEVLQKLIASSRSNRYSSADKLLEALGLVGELRQTATKDVTVNTSQSWEELGKDLKPNTNPFVEFLLTLYSQSSKTNAGTRGLDTWSRKIYVETQLDRKLHPEILDGRFKLVIISGNAGDGKTAFIQQVERAAEKAGAQMVRDAHGNSAQFEYKGRRFLSNYDGSQDEGDKVNDSVLQEFFKPYTGEDTAKWPDSETRLIAINEGRLVDFLEQHQKQYPRLKELVSSGFQSGKPESGIAVVNLNLRSVVATSKLDDGTVVESILERLLKRMVDARFWSPCAGCDLADKCYAYHNARTFQDKTSGPQLLERLMKLYSLTSLRSKLHITLRDVRSALAFMLVGTRNCDDIHELYRNGDRNELINGFYYNSWMGGFGKSTGDRLVKLLRESDVGISADAKLDRLFGFHPPKPTPQLAGFEDRGNYDSDLLMSMYDNLPREIGGINETKRFSAFKSYVGMVRRKHFFESRDESWKRLLPYKSSESMLALISGEHDPHEEASHIISAINKGEGIFDSGRLKGRLALQVRNVEQGTIRSYRLFPSSYFRLDPVTKASDSPFMEHSPNALALRFQGGALFGHAEYFEENPELEINLDVYEMLYRLNDGYRPTVDELHGYYLSLNVFKNILSSVPYDEILLTPAGKTFYSIKKDESGRLTMRVAEDVGEYGS